MKHTIMISILFLFVLIGCAVAPLSKEQSLQIRTCKISIAQAIKNLENYGYEIEENKNGIVRTTSQLLNYENYAISYKLEAKGHNTVRFTRYMEWNGNKIPLLIYKHPKAQLYDRNRVCGDSKIIKTGNGTISGPYDPK